MCKKIKRISRIALACLVVFSMTVSTINIEAANYSMTQPVETFVEQQEDEELTHLLLAKLVYDYMDDYEGMNVEEYVADNPRLYQDEIWDGQGVTYESLYSLYVGDWQIYKVCNHNSTTGFYSVAFKKDNRVIIAFRGSEMFTDEFALDESNDWTGTDLKFAVFNELSRQFDDADAFYKLVVGKLAMDGVKESEAKITLTGHSLGGALTSYEALMSGSYGYCFDGACGHVMDLTYYYDYMGIDNFTGVDDPDNIMFCNYTDTTGYVVADLIQHSTTEGIYQVDRETNLEDLNENTLIPKMADAGSHIIWSSLECQDGVVSFTPKVDVNEAGFTYMPDGPVYLDITKNVIQEGMNYIDLDTPLNMIDYQNIDYEQLAGSLTGIVKDGRVVLASYQGGALTSYNGVGVTSAYDIDMVMYGGRGDDTLIGYVDNDVLISGTGEDVLDGNLGDDIYVIDRNPGHTTRIRDIGGDTTTIIFRNVSISKLSKLKVDDNGYIDLGDDQYIKLDDTKDFEDIELYTFNNGRIRSLGTLADTNKEVQACIRENVDISDLSDRQKNVLMLEGYASLDIYDNNGDLIISFDNKAMTDSSGNNATMQGDVGVIDYEFGAAYINCSQDAPSIYVIMDSDYQVVINSDKERCNLALGVIDEENMFLGCDRKYTRRFNNYEVNFENVIYYGLGQGEVDWSDAIYEGINWLDELLGN
ncbi:MAG: hypothetical protein IJZ96_11800 [Lachnospiraceae bacterium]|nr:hypothetical protein [Lachnospiraceae bacterium]MBQ8316846.1 hypothetical protein [Lachnospiraceae bacterium]